MFEAHRLRGNGIPWEGPRHCSSRRTGETLLFQSKGTPINNCHKSISKHASGLGWSKSIKPFLMPHGSSHHGLRKSVGDPGGSILRTQFAQHPALEAHRGLVRVGGRSRRGPEGKRPQGRSIASGLGLRPMFTGHGSCNMGVAQNLRARVA